MTIIFLVAGSFQLLLEAAGIARVTTTVAVLLALILPLIMILLCEFDNTDDKKWVHLYVKITTYLYSLFMLAVLLVIVSNFIPSNKDAYDVGTGWYCGLCNINNVFFLFLVLIYLVAGILHPSEFMCLASGAIYYCLMPTMFIFLNIYSFMGLDILKWGTREDKVKTEEQMKADEARFQVKQKWTCSITDCLLCRTKDCCQVRLEEKPEGEESYDDDYMGETNFTMDDVSPTTTNGGLFGAVAKVRNRKGIDIIEEEPKRNSLSPSVPPSPATPEMKIGSEKFKKFLIQHLLVFRNTQPRVDIVT